MDGRYAELDINESTLIAARDAVQKVLESFTWTGPPRLFLPHLMAGQAGLLP
jgi:hypothetical protein